MTFKVSPGVDIYGVDFATNNKFIGGKQQGEEINENYLKCGAVDDEYSQLILDASPTAYYKCDEFDDATSIQDYSGNGFHAPFTNNNYKNAFPSTPIRIGGAGSHQKNDIVVSSQTDYWTIPLPAIANTKSMEMIFCAIGGSDCFAFTQSSSNSVRVELFLYQTGSPRYAVTVSGSTSVGMLSDDVYPDERGRPRHLCLQYIEEDSASYLWIDGVKQSDPIGGDVFSHAYGTEARIGVRKFNNTYSGRDNQLSDVAFYDEVLTQEQIEARANIVTQLSEIWDESDKPFDMNVIGYKNEVVSIVDKRESQSIRGKIGHTTGKKYFELVPNYGANVESTVNPYLFLGVADANTPLTGMNLISDNSGGAYSCAALRGHDGEVYRDDNTDIGSHAVFSDGTPVGVAVDFDAGKAWWSVDNVFPGNPVAGTGQSFDFTPNTELFPFFYRYDATGSTWYFMEVSLKLCSDDLINEPPTGFDPWVA